MAHQLQRPTGMVLLEVLTALVVVSIALLGVAVLTISALGANRTALLRTRAVLLAGDMADRIRVNCHDPGAYDCGGACETGRGGNPLAVADIANWTAAVGSELPAGRTEITRPATPADAPTTYVVRVNWDEAGGGQDGFELVVQCGGAT